MTNNEAVKKLMERFREYPYLGEVAESAALEKAVVDVLAFESLDPTLFGILMHETQTLLGLYTPLHDFAHNIEESLRVSPEVASRIALTIQTLALEDVIADLEAYDALWQAELERETSILDSNIAPKEELELRPKGVPVGGGGAAQPRMLTRDELMQALGSKRTMANDIARAREEASAIPPPPAPTTPPPQMGY